MSSGVFLCTSSTPSMKPIEICGTFIKLRQFFRLLTFCTLLFFILFYNMNTLLMVIWLHFFGDFICQSDSMAQNKSKSNKWLGIHVSTYMIPFCLVFGWRYALINGLAHFIVDWNTSRVTSRLWQEKRVHDFFVVIGLDQALHMSMLLWTAHTMLHAF